MNAILDRITILLTIAALFAPLLGGCGSANQREMDYCDPRLEIKVLCPGYHGEKRIWMKKRANEGMLAIYQIDLRSEKRTFIGEIPCKNFHILWCEDLETSVEIGIHPKFPEWEPITERLRHPHTT